VRTVIQASRPARAMESAEEPAAKTNDVPISR